MLATCAVILFTLQNPLKQPNVFPIAVWLQEPSMATRYKAAGFNMYVGLWEGPTDKQLQALSEAGMPVICDQNAVGLKNLRNPIIAGWMHGDEPDNAQPVKDPVTGKDSWGPCIPPERIVADYHRIKAADPSRPVMLNLGQGVANDKWYGRGNGAKLDDYRTYVQGCDIVSFDVYPVAGVGDANQLGLVAKGVDRLVGWTKGDKLVWNCLECTQIGGKGKPTPAQVKAEAWSAIIHGSRGLIYFVHQFQPKFNEHALLDDPEMLKAVTELNGTIQAVWKVLSGPKDVGANPFRTSVGVEWCGCKRGDARFYFGVSLKSEPTTLQVADGTEGLEQVDPNTFLPIGKVAGTFTLPPYGFAVFRAVPTSN